MCDLSKDAPFSERLRHDFRNMPYRGAMIYMSVITTLILLSLYFDWRFTDACP